MSEKKNVGTESTMLGVLNPGESENSGLVTPSAATGVEFVVPTPK